MTAPVGRSTTRDHLDRRQTPDSRNFVAIKDVPKGGQHQIIVFGQFGELLHNLENRGSYRLFRLSVFFLAQSPPLHCLFLLVFLLYNLDAVGAREVTTRP
jgi:hypothetical protein